MENFSTELATLLIVTNVPDQSCAERIAALLVESRLAACVNILPGVHSVYRWRGAVEKAREITLLIKTTTERYPDVETAIRLHHPAELPEIIALPLVRGLRTYLQWIAHETRDQTSDYA